jgi:hypothetical protein
VLKNAIDNRTIDEWFDEDFDWEVSSIDNIAWRLNICKPEDLPVKFGEPTMGVVPGSNECVSIYDYKNDCPDYMEKVEADAIAFRQQKILERDNLRLPLGDRAPTTKEPGQI